MQRARECLEEIVSLYQSGPKEMAPELLQRITDLYFLTLEQQSATETGSFGDVMIRMCQSADTVARAHFAERMSKAKQAPIEVIRILARDEICVARPILQYSKCLREGDLVTITSDAAQEHMVAIAHRTKLTEVITDILIARGHEEVLTALAQNVSAELSSSSKRRLFAIAETDEALFDVLNGRRDTTSNPIGRLKRLGEPEFWHRVAETLLMAPDETDTAIPEPQTPLSQTASDPEPDDEHKEEASAPAPAATMSNNPAVNEKLLVEAARGGKITETIELLGKISGLDMAMVEHCLFQAHLPALMVLCKANKLAASSFTSLLQLRENYTETAISDTIGLLRRYEAMTPDTAKRVIRFADKGKPESGD